MNIVEVTGGKPYQRKYVESIAFFCIDKLMPKMESLDINIKLRTIPEDSYGYCMSETTREFDIEIDKNLTLRKLLRTVAHEIVHVKQYARKELTGDSTWQGKTYKPKTTDHWYEPWEIEAHGRECGLFIRWAEKMKLAEKKWTQE